MADPDLQIRGVGGGGGLQNIFFSALGVSVWSKNKGGGGGLPGAPPLDTPLQTLICWGNSFHSFVAATWFQDLGPVT